VGTGSGGFDHGWERGKGGGEQYVELGRAGGSGRRQDSPASEFVCQAGPVGFMPMWPRFTVVGVGRPEGK